MTMKNIAIVSALIALIGVGISAFSYLKPANISQKSAGDKAPNIGVVGGNVEINN